ncbi:2-isopropylmalate synthase [Pseudodesulfovibrio piezophilus]|uniref:2-isopropylmalate synthase n=1 Tax=Pseudodesulfovibrio piezophilus (strain DSM 21447 / JCM 15486 / C1TLV30) TaxID=1322246 RepID=M1WPY5_PSEP2|nr:2-isopropylmalate synthase [Pseudodesulfovibrio piezophilus]CCH47352.1 2-isopropylmalate synthase [Pseudodesulfovibrio piezophilus C1TLV30]
MAERVYVFDTTLRDGEQSPGATMNLDEKIRMARQLETLGVDIIEAGFPIASQGDFEAVQAIAKVVESAQVAGLCRSVSGDIDRCWEAIKEANHPRIHIFLATSEIHMQYKLGKTADEVLAMAEKAVKHAKQYTDNIEFSAEDASRSDWDFLVKVTETVIEAGATVVNIPDTVGYTQPFEYYEMIKYLKDNVKNVDKAIISVHCHNDLGAAVANSLAAVRAGARQVECTILGIGERAGNAALEDLVMTLNTRKELYDVETGIKTEQLFPSCRRLSQIIGMPIPPNKAIVGANAFAHESGVHQDGVIKNRLTYEIMTPASIGRTSNDIVIGKHSGSHAVKNKAIELGYSLDDEQVMILFKAVKDLADKKEHVFDEDVEAMILESVYRRRDRFRLIDMSVFSGTGDVPPHAAMVMEFGSEGDEVAVRRTSEFGEGSVDAAFQSIYSLVGIDPKLEVYTVNAVTQGSDALASVAVRIEHEGVKAVGRANDGDVVKASALAMVNALNRLEKAKEEK